MSMYFEELDGVTRSSMLLEFEAEQLQSPYFGERLCRAGRNAFPELMRQSIREGNEITLRASILRTSFWESEEPYTRNGITRMRRINIHQAAEQLANSEFNSWYVRGLSRKLLDAGVERCQAYRAAHPKWEPGECSEHEGALFLVKDVYDGHRVHYWPKPGDKSRLSIPFHPGCHHTIRRYAA